MRKTAIAAALLAATAGAGPAVAQQASPGNLRQICEAFLSSKEVRAGKANDALCQCLVGRIMGGLSMEEMQAYAGSAGKPGNDAPAGLEDKVRGIAKDCLRKSEQ